MSTDKNEYSAPGSIFRISSSRAPIVHVTNPIKSIVGSAVNSIKKMFGRTSCPPESDGFISSDMSIHPFNKDKPIEALVCLENLWCETLNALLKLEAYEVQFEDTTMVKHIDCSKIIDVPVKTKLIQTSSYEDYMNPDADFQTSQKEFSVHKLKGGFCFPGEEHGKLRGALLARAENRPLVHQNYFVVNYVEKNKHGAPSWICLQMS